MFFLVYLDDIFVFLKIEKEYVAHMTKVLKIIGRHWLYEKLSKYYFAKVKFQYLHYIMGKVGDKINLAKMKTIMQWNMPCVGLLPPFQFFTIM